jgi:1-deoxy-D-xylulose-5-phosphate reductoisomerase
LEGVTEAACHPDVDMVVAGISGAAGLVPTYRAILEHKHIALANKETLVMAGDLIVSSVKASRVSLLPVDSEHCALHQCLRGSRNSDVRRLVLTASGGPFFGCSEERLSRVTVDEALNHPTWRMGPKITIDSATLMNKGLEVIEAHHLFQVDADRIVVVIHPQSVIHSMVEFIDGAVLAQMSITDMRAAILYALSYPERWTSILPTLDFLQVSPLEFFAPDLHRFPCLTLAYQALRHGRTYPVCLNAANEVAVTAFLERKIPFTAIPEVIEESLAQHRPVAVDTLEPILEADQQSRQSATAACQVHALS